MTENDTEHLTPPTMREAIDIHIGNDDAERLNTVAAMGQGIKVGDVVRYTRGDVSPLRGITGNVLGLYTHEYEDGLEVEMAQVEFTKRPEMFQRGIALVNLEVVPQSDELAALKAEVQRLRAALESIASNKWNMRDVREYANATLQGKHE